MIKLRDVNGAPIPLINIRLSTNDASSDEAYDDKFTDLAGNTAWPNPLRASGGYTLYVNYDNINKKYKSLAVHVLTLDNDINIVLEALTPVFSKVHIENDKFINELGNEWLWNMSSNFMLMQRFADGENIDSLLYDTAGYRVTGIYHNIAQQVGKKDFSPLTYDNYLVILSDFANYLASHGKCFQFNLFCDLQYFTFTLDQLKYWHSGVAEVLSGHNNVFYSLGNENQNNGFNADDFTKPNGIISACGSGLTGGPAPLCNGRAWDIQHQHLRRDDKMFIDIPPVDAPTYDLAHMIIFDETIGFANYNSSSRTSRSDWAYKMARIASAFNGITIHIENGIHSEPLNDVELQCLSEYNRGMK